MPIPDVFLTIKDGALGLLPEQSDGLSVKIGVSSLGAANTLFVFAPTGKEELKATLGQGPLVEAAAHHLDVSGQPVICVPVNASVAGTNSVVVKTGAGTGNMAVGGAPRDAYEAIVEILKAGVNLAAATATFRYSLDGGDTFSPEIALPVSGIFVIPDSGLTLTFTNGVGTSFAVGDKYTFTSTAPSYALVDLNAALDAILADVREWGFVHIVGAANASIAAGVDAKMTAAENSFRYAFAILEARDANVGESNAAWQASIIADFASFSSARVMVSAGFEELSSAISGRIYRRSSAWGVAARTAKAPISEDLGRVASGSIPGVSKLYHNEQVTPGLDAQRFATMRTIIGRSGFYITAGKMMAPGGSDFTLVQRRRVLDRACKVARNALLDYLNESVLVDSAGNIDEVAARAIEQDVTGQLLASLAGHISDAQVTIDRTNNILSTEILKATVSIVPLGYARRIEVTIGFRNPALVVEAAA